MMQSMYNASISSQDALKRYINKRLDNLEKRVSRLECITAKEVHEAFLDIETGLVDELSYVEDSPTDLKRVTVDGVIDFERIAEWINSREP